MASLTAIRLSQLGAQLNQHRNNFQAISKIFAAHCSSDFLDQLLQDELTNSLHGDKTDRDFMELADPYKATLIADGKFKYSVFMTDPQGAEEPVDCMDMNQIWVIKGQGRLRVQILRLPDQINPASFEENVKYELLE